MDIILVGYGRMGKSIERLALQRGHIVVERYDAPTSNVFRDTHHFERGDVCIEFSVPQAAEINCSHCLDIDMPVVSGTTGWLEGVRTLQERANREGKSFFYASNFSLGVNVLFELNRRLAKIMGEQTDYIPFIKETHHIHKLDAPSGTALTLAESIVSNSNRFYYEGLSNSLEGERLEIESVREGEVPGIHEVVWRSSVDKISLCHEAFSRNGFALGAILAAEYALTHKGALTMEQMLGF